MLSPKNRSPQQGMLKRPVSKRSTERGKGNNQTKCSYCITRYLVYDTNTNTYYSTCPLILYRNDIAFEEYA